MVISKKQKKYWITGAIVFALLLLPRMARASWYTITDWLIPEFESFRAHPYLDGSRYSWGYGTAAPGATGTITKEQALADMRAYLQGDYNYLSTLISRPLSGNQWAALLSFSYNLGAGSAANLVADINAGSDSVLEDHWKQYIYSSGSVNTNLVHRRNVEWQMWKGELSE